MNAYFSVFRRLFFQLLILFGFFSCSSDSDEPSLNLVACFNVNETAIIGESVAFNSGCTKNASSYQWSFGNLGSSEESNPTFIFGSAGTYTITLEVSNGEQHHSVEKIITILNDSENIGDNCIQHNNVAITENQTWKTGETHCISGFVSIKNATVTIEPGVEILFSKNASIEVGFDTGPSAIVAIGTASHPILFTSAESNPQPGDWVGVKFLEHATSVNILKHCVIEYGGSNAFTSDKVAMVGLAHGGTVSIESSVFRNSLTYALETDSHSGFTNFINNNISLAGDYAIFTSANKYHTIGTPNEINNQGILVQNHVIDETVIWKKQSCPIYMNQGGISVRSTAGNTLTLDPGIELKFPNHAANLTVGASGMQGKLIANGTAQNPILFTTYANDPAINGWGGVLFDEGTMSGSLLNNVQISYVHKNTSDHGAIEIRNEHVSITNTNLSHCNSINILQQSSFAEFSNNTINNNGNYPIKINASNVASIGAGNIVDGSFPIFVHGSIVEGNGILWRDLGVPYLITSKLLIGNSQNTDFTLEPGVELHFDNNAGISAMSPNETTFMAIGTTDKPILFTAATISSGNAVAGDWDGIELGSSVANGSIIQNCTIQYGGGRYANIYTNLNTTDQLSIINCTITDSSKYGISHTAGVTPVLTNNIFANNALGNTD